MRVKKTTPVGAIKLWNWPPTPDEDVPSVRAKGVLVWRAIALLLHHHTPSTGPSRHPCSSSSLFLDLVGSRLEVDAPLQPVLPPLPPALQSLILTPRISSFLFLLLILIIHPSGAIPANNPLPPTISDELVSSPHPLDTAYSFFGLLHHPRRLPHHVALTKSSIGPWSRPAESLVGAWLLLSPYKLLLPSGSGPTQHAESSTRSCALSIAFAASQLQYPPSPTLPSLDRARANAGECSPPHSPSHAPPTSIRHVLARGPRSCSSTPDATLLVAVDPVASTSAACLLDLADSSMQAHETNAFPSSSSQRHLRPTSPLYRRTPHQYRQPLRHPSHRLSAATYGFLTAIPPTEG
ncbi:uncharacterized protein PAN0_002d0961 [Moesziomyces antarcticus]|uniref:uncharacterized protein n=1 Tax=Pseudozyma antarctica TaxID=84753 RepID=UPI00071981A6|nr:uncharacterized protein PAN0_002d0961 [Moesziomyces antarcticus]GAK62759.1 hypothetical protein PAN0_002d0961 [Moesziomyces antarcticus]